MILSKYKLQKEKNFILIFLLFALFISMVSCKGNFPSEDNSQQNTELSWDSKYVTMSFDKRMATIDLKDKFDKEVQFDAHNLIGANYIIGESLNIKIQSDAEIVKAEKITHYYPTIWAGMDDEVIQFIYLFDYEYKDIFPLTIENEIIKYPAHELGGDGTIKDYFRKITKKQIVSSIEKVPAEYKRKGTHLIFEYNSWQSEKKIWNTIAQKYTPGDLTNTEYEPFEINPYEIDLVVTFKGEKGEFTKTFHDEAVVGN